MLFKVAPLDGNWSASSAGERTPVFARYCIADSEWTRVCARAALHCCPPVSSSGLRHSSHRRREVNLTGSIEVDEIVRQRARHCVRQPLLLSVSIVCLSLWLRLLFC